MPPGLLFCGAVQSISEAPIAQLQSVIGSDCTKVKSHLSLACWPACLIRFFSRVHCHLFLTKFILLVLTTLLFFVFFSLPSSSTLPRPLGPCCPISAWAAFGSSRSNWNHICVNRLQMQTELLFVSCFLSDSDPFSVLDLSFCSRFGCNVSKKQTILFQWKLSAIFSALEVFVFNGAKCALGSVSGAAGGPWQCCQAPKSPAQLHRSWKRPTASLISDLWSQLGVWVKDREATHVQYFSQEALIPGHAQYFLSIVPSMPVSLSLFLFHPLPLPSLVWLLPKLSSSSTGLREDNWKEESGMKAILFGSLGCVK